MAVSTYPTHLMLARIPGRGFRCTLDVGSDPAKTDRYRRVPWFHLTEWQAPQA